MAQITKLVLGPLHDTEPAGARNSTRLSTPAVYARQNEIVSEELSDNTGWAKLSDTTLHFCF